MCVYVYTCVDVRVYMYTYMCVYVYMCICACVYVYAYIYMYVCKLSSPYSNCIYMYHTLIYSRHIDSVGEASLLKALHEEFSQPEKVHIHAYIHTYIDIHI